MTKNKVLKYYCRTSYKQYYASYGGSIKETKMKYNLFNNLNEMTDFIMEQFKEYYIGSYHRQNYSNGWGGAYDYDQLHKYFHSRILMGKDFFQEARYDESELRYKFNEDDQDIWRTQIISYLDRLCKVHSPIKVLKCNEQYIIGAGFMGRFHYPENPDKQCLGLLSEDKLKDADMKPMGGKDLFHIEYGLICVEEEAELNENRRV